MNVNAIKNDHGGIQGDDESFLVPTLTEHWFLILGDWVVVQRYIF